MDVGGGIEAPSFSLLRASSKSLRICRVSVKFLTLKPSPNGASSSGCCQLLRTKPTRQVANSINKNFRTLIETFEFSTLGNQSLVAIIKRFPFYGLLCCAVVFFCCASSGATLNDRVNNYSPSPPHSLRNFPAQFSFTTCGKWFFCVVDLNYLSLSL